MATKHPKHTEALDPKIIAELASQASPVEPGHEAASRMRNKLFQRLHAAQPDYLFVHSHEGDWVSIIQGVEVKILRQDADTRSMLIRMAPDTRLPAHAHDLDEESLVLEGEVTVQGVHCNAGDYHFAPAGKDHSQIETTTGCLLFVRGSTAQSARQ
jgi:quercetin dioxygenase-like cupin family protein